MLELELIHKKTHILTNGVDKNDFEDPLVFYLVHKDNVSNFFITYALLDLPNNEINYYFSNTDKNKKIINNAKNKEIFDIFKVPHCAIRIEKNKNFFVFMQEEEFFVLLDTTKNCMFVYTMDDFNHRSNVIFKKISSTFFKDPENNNVFYLSAVDENETIHIFRCSLDLSEIEEIDSLPGKADPPHVLRKYKKYLLLSHEFNDAKYKLLKTNNTIDSNHLSLLFLRTEFKNESRIKSMIETEPHTKNVASNIHINEERKALLKLMKEKYEIECAKGKIILLNLENKTKKYYKTSGGSPAHFEIDEKEDMIYVSSHNFFNRKNSMMFIQPAVIDKYQLVNDDLIWRGSFSSPFGYRFASHRLFRYRDKLYICTIAHPNRILFIDAKTMKLVFYEDIEFDELSNFQELDVYLSARESDFQIVPIEVSVSGEQILFMSHQYIYIYNFSKKMVTEKITYIDNDIKEDTDNLCLKNYKLKTVHINYLN